jgi:hypothetical protein
MILILFDVSNSYWKNKIKFRLQFHQLLSKLFSKIVDQQICVYIWYGFANLLIYLWVFFFFFLQWASVMAGYLEVLKDEEELCVKIHWTARSQSKAKIHQQE